MIALFRRVQWWLQRRRKEDDLREELEFHLSEEASERRADGLAEQDARWAARRDLGNATLIREEVRGLWSWKVLEQLAQDVRYALRNVRRSPGLACIAILTLAIGIGANTTLFTWVKAVLLRPVPGATDPASLSVAVVVSPDGVRHPWSYPDYRDVHDRATTFEPIAQADLFLSVAVDGHPERAYGAIVSGNYFRVMGVGAVVGRVLTPDDDRTPSGHPVAVLSYPFWQRRFGGDPGIVGREIVVNNVPLTVVGVSQAGFIGSFMGTEIGVFLPIAMQPPITGSNRLDARTNAWLMSWARARPGVSRARANAEIDAIVRQLEREYPGPNEGRHAAIIAPRDAPFGAPVVLDTMLTVLSVVAMLVLALACANVANILLSRAVDRRREMGVRVSLGASRARLLRQLLTESMLLATAAGVASAVLVYWTSGLLMTFLPPLDAPVDLAIKVDGPTLIFALAISLVTGLLFGCAPAWQTSRVDSMTSLKDEGGRGGGATGRGLRSALVVIQVAVCLVLLVVGGLFMRSLAAARSIDPGFDPQRQLSAAMELPASLYTPDAGRQLYDRVLARVTALPSVESAAFSRRLPLGFRSQSSARVQIEGYTPRNNEQPVIGYNVVSTGYFATMGIPIVRGRDFSSVDAANGQLAVVINETTAKRYWGERDPLGAAVQAGDTYVVIGIARDSKYGTLDEPPQAHLYFNVAQRYVSGVILQVRTAGDPVSLAGPVREAIRAIEPALAVWDLRPVSSHMEQAYFAQRLGANILALMSGLALLLAAVGLYGVMAHAVSRRTQEIGIRLALGASARTVRRMVVTQGMKLTLIGLTIGLMAAFGAAKLLASLLPGIEPTDPVTFVIVPLVLLAVAFIATCVPAVRAARVDPMVALRCE